LYYYRLLYYVFLVLTLIVLWTFICICILHYYSLWNHAKISFWICYYMSLWLVWYCSVNTETKLNLPIPSFFRTNRYQFSEEPNLHKYRRTEPKNWMPRVNGSTSQSRAPDVSPLVHEVLATGKGSPFHLVRPTCWRESWDKLHFLASPNPCFCEGRRKITSPVKLF
jgi:hypothetical protein